MNFDLASVANAGDLERERIVLKATGSEADVGRYAVFRCWTGKQADMVLSGPVPNAYWFANQKVKANDFIVLYTKSGTKSEKTGENGVTSYFFYWGLPQAIWVPNYTPVLIETATWEFGAAIQGKQSAAQSSS